MSELTGRAVVSEPVVTRWVRAPRRQLEGVLADLAGPHRSVVLDGEDELVFTGGFQARRSGAWAADARLAGDRVEVELWLWCDDSGELNIRPARRQSIGLAWGARHERRYFDLAHRAAARLADLLTTPPVHSGMGTPQAA